MKRAIPAISAALLSTGLLVAGIAAPADASARVFKNCTDMHKTYKHGVGKSGARDNTSGTPVTNFKRSNALYQANKKSDRDRDGIACEKR